MVKVGLITWGQRGCRLWGYYGLCSQSILTPTPTPDKLSLIKESTHLLGEGHHNVVVEVGVGVVSEGACGSTDQEH